MSRAPVPFSQVWDDVAVACDCAPSDVAGNTVLQDKLLNLFNRAYERCWNASEWEDAWKGESKTVTDGKVAFSLLEDARRFSVWSEDPQPKGSKAYAVPFVTSADGIHIQADLSEVWVMYLPKAPRFTLAEMGDNVLGVLVEPVVDMTAGKYLKASGSYGTGQAREGDARARLEEAYAEEFQRVQRCPWRRKN